jgi:hypothetical protein
MQMNLNRLLRLFNVSWLLSIGLASIVAIEPTRSDIPNLAPRETAIGALGLVKNRADLMRLSGKQVKIVGYYTSQSSQPGIDANTIGFKGAYIKSQIVLEDGTVVHIFPSWLKQSLRSSDEAAKYTGQIAEATGIIKFEAASGSSAIPRESFIELKELKLVNK